MAFRDEGNIKKSNANLNTSSKTAEILSDPNAAKVRQLFPETWLWTMFITTKDKDGEMVLNENAPDTITSWVATAFSMSSRKGIGIMQSPAELTVFKSCFADLRLPYSAVRMEELELRVVVFNYENSKQKITVTLKKSSNFYARALNEISPTKSQQVVQEVTVAAGDGVEVNFDIKPVKLGDLPVEVHISSNLCSDALRKDLLTEAEGEPCDYSKAFFFALKDEAKTEEVTISFPEDVVEGSQRILITAIGDIMGSSAANLDNLIRQPSGCGEQNMLNFAPNIYVMDYFEATDTGSSEDRAKVKKFMTSGYQNELKFKRTDGSFSAFGQSDESGSTWLTAFVLRCFKQAKEYIGIDTNVLSAGAEFILKYQNKDGSFAEPGRVIHSDMQGKASKGIPLTAYIAKVLNEIKEELDPALQAKVDTALAKTKTYLEGQLEEIKDNGYSLALVCYFLCDVDSNKADKCLDYFEDLATKTGGSMYWDLGGTEVETEGWRSPYSRPRSNNVEVTAYGLLTFCLKGKTGKAAAVTKWLSSQRSSLGGYGSTQDTVIALQALSTFASKSSIGDGTEINVEVLYGDETHKFNKIRKINADVLQMHDISDAGDLSEVTVNIQGSGTVLVQVNVFFNKKDSAGSSGYDLKLDSEESDGTVQIKACVRYNIDDHESGMVVIEIEMLTAYEPSISELLSTYSGIGLRKVEYKGKTVAMYFDEWKGKEECVELSAKPTSKVNNLQAAQAQVYSYYANKERDSALYLPQSLMVSEGDGSSTEENPGVGTVIGGAAGVTIAAVSVLMPAVMAFILVLLFRM